MPRRSRRFNKKNIMSMLIIFFMVSSVFGVMFYGFSSSMQKKKIDGKTFTLTQAGVMTKVEGEKLYFQYFPDDVEDIPMTDASSSLLGSNALYITYDPYSPFYREMALFQFNLQQFLQKNFGSYAVLAMTEDYEQGSLPVIDCLNASSVQPVVKISEANSTRIRDLGNCVIVEFDTSFNIDRALDRIKYTLLGILG